MARNDENEVSRLQRSCPRRTYAQQDAEYEDRCKMTFDIMAVVCIDLRCMWGKLHALESARTAATAHYVTAALAFLDGERCEKGKPQTEFFVRELPAPDAPDTDDASDDADGDDDEDDEGWDPEDEDDDAGEPPPALLERGRRMDAVQARAEHFSNCGVVALVEAIAGIAEDLVNTWAAYTKFCRTRLGVSPETMMRAWEFPLDEFQETLGHYQTVKPQPKVVEEYFGYITKQWDQRFLGPPGQRIPRLRGRPGGRPWLTPRAATTRRSVRTSGLC